MIEHRHLPHVSSFRDNPIVFFTTCTHKRRKLLACAQSHVIFTRPMGTLGRTRWLVGWSLHSDARSRSFLCASCNYCAANGEMDADVEERQLPTAHGPLDIAPPVWQPKYFDRYLRSRENYGQKWNYVEQNALGAGLAKEGEEWPYRGSIFDLMW